MTQLMVDYGVNFSTKKGVEEISGFLSSQLPNSIILPSLKNLNEKIYQTSRKFLSDTNSLHFTLISPLSIFQHYYHYIRVNHWSKRDLIIV